VIAGLLLAAALQAAVPAVLSVCSGADRTPLAAHRAVPALSTRSAAGIGCPLAATRDPLPRRAARERWFAADKVRHFFMSAFIQSVSYSALRAAHAEHGASLAGASVVTAAFGVGKEVYDRRVGNDFSVRDLVWDAAGAGAATLLLERTRR
jgi:uncharacterized protein YfiM (DUF2279 family)